MKVARRGEGERLPSLQRDEEQSAVAKEALEAEGLHGSESNSLRRDDQCSEYYVARRRTRCLWVGS